MIHSSDADALNESRQTRRAAVAFLFVLKADVAIPNSPLHRAAGATKKGATHTLNDNTPKIVLTFTLLIKSTGGLSGAAAGKRLMRVT